MRIEAKPLSDYPWYIRLFFWKQRRSYGKVLDPGLLWGRSPRVFAGLALLYGTLDRKGSPLAPALRSLVTVRVSQINHCAFCLDVNSATLMKRGVALEKAEAVAHWRTSEMFDDREQAALAYAEAITRSDASVDDALMARLKGQFDDDAVVELTGLIAFQNMSSKFNGALDVPSQGFCSIPRPEQPGSGDAAENGASIGPGVDAA